MSCTAAAEGLVTGLAWAEGTAEAQEEEAEDGVTEGIVEGRLERCSGALGILQATCQLQNKHTALHESTGIMHYIMFAFCAVRAHINSQVQAAVSPRL
jgi:hypothetical protein